MASNNTSNFFDTLASIRSVSSVALNKVAVYMDKDYDSLIEFLIDILRSFGITEQFIIQKIISLIVTPEIAQNISNFKEKQLNKAYEDLENAGEGLNTGWLVSVEDAVKVVIQTILTALLSCSINPFLPAYAFYSGDTSTIKDHGIKIPLSVLDFSGVLQISPLGTSGRYFYNLDSSIMKAKTINSGTSAETTSYVAIPGLLYRTADLNAFIWNALNRGNADTTIEKNKLVWDSRKKSKQKYGKDKRSGESGWTSWLKCISANTTDTEFPILRMEKGEASVNETCLKVYFPIETYIKGENPPVQWGDLSNRATIFKFNSDYLKSIQLFSPKVIIMNMLMELSKVKIFPEISANISIKKQIMDAKISSAVAKIMVADDMNVSDCFYSFSNNDYNELLKEADLRIYGAKSVNTQDTAAVVYDPSIIDNASNEISNSATLNEETDTIVRTVYDIVNTPATKEQVKSSLGIDFSISCNFLSDILYAIIMPLVRAVFSPQVMLLFLINFEVMGIIDLSKLDGNALQKLTTIIYRKMIGALKTIVVLLKDSIFEILYKIFEDEFKKLLEEFTLTLILEEIEAWIKLLEQALALLKKNNVTDNIHAINYADITTEQNVPEIEGGC